MNVIVRGASAIPPRGSTEIEAGDELHILARREAIGEVEGLTERWRTGPLGDPPPAQLPIRGAPQVFTVRKRRPDDGDPARPDQLEDIEVAARLRVRRDTPGALVGLADGRYAVTSPELVAVGARRHLAEWVGRRVRRPGLAPVERAWLEEVAGALNAPAPRRRPEADVDPQVT